MIIIEDNFLNNVEKYRLDAIKMYNNGKKISAKNYPGYKINVNPEVKLFFTEKIKNILKEHVSCGEMCYQFVSKDYVKGIPHVDTQYKYTMIFYLNPIPDQNSGTEIYENYSINRDKIIFKNSSIVLPKKEKFFSKQNKTLLDKFYYNFLISSILLDFNCPTIVANRYNRLLIFNSNYVHRAQNYFGNNENSRLCLVGFFK